MADLTEVQSAQAVKIAGANPSTGVESNFLDIDSSGKLTAKLNDGTGTSVTSTLIGSNQSLDVNIANPFIATAPVAGTLTDRSGTATNTSSQIMAANSNRKYLFIQNTGNSAIWIDFTNSATITQPSIQLINGASFVMEGNFVSTEAINVISVSSSSVYTAKEG